MKNYDQALLRIEDRLSAADSNYYIAMAATIAGIDLVLQKYVKTYDPESVPLGTEDDEKENVFDLGEKVLVIDKTAHPDTSAGACKGYFRGAY